MRILLVYDCLYPWTVGGAERWYRTLGERLAAEGHEVTYATLRQWPRDEPPHIEGVRVVATGPRMELYSGPGRRRVLPPLVFGAGMLGHLLRHGRRYDVVHTASFPYFSLLAAAMARPLGGFRLVVDWHELWSRAYWREYLGAIGGRVGWSVQRLCIRVPQRAFCFAHRTADRLRESGLKGGVTVLKGEYGGPLEVRGPAPAQPVVVFAGRHIPEKRVPAIVPAVALAREHAPELRALLLGDGPDREEVLRLAAPYGDVISAPGFVSGDEVDAALAGALCLLLPSRREGYGLVVVEAASRGTPSIVVDDPDNAAVELVADGVNGVVAASASPEDLAAAILRVRETGDALRASTAAWFSANAPRLSIGASLDTVVEAYG